eukprot:2195532-Pyramimonas_sp.AAC.1
MAGEAHSSGLGARTSRSASSPSSATGGSGGQGMEAHAAGGRKWCFQAKQNGRATPSFAEEVRRPE